MRSVPNPKTIADTGFGHNVDRPGGMPFQLQPQVASSTTSTRGPGPSIFNLLLPHCVGLLRVTTRHPLKTKNPLVYNRSGPTVEVFPFN
jgi:hypothetical protein